MNFQDNLDLAIRLLPKESLNTLYMVFVSGFFSLLIGMPIGILLYITNKGGLHERAGFYRIFGFFINIGRAVPFAILSVAIIPFTRWIVGTSLGTTASIVPLTIAAIPFMARIVEGALKEVSKEIIDAALAMGIGIKTIIFRVLIPESLPSLISGVTLALNTLVGYSAMVGLIGGGGLGKIAIQYGYQRFNGFLMISTLIILILLVEIIEFFGNKIVQYIRQKRGLQKK